MSEYMKSEDGIRFELITNEEDQDDEYIEDRTSFPRQKQMNNKRFKKEYMSIPKFSNWLHGVDGDEKKFFCSYCEKEFLGGKWEINKHYNSSKHQKNSEKYEPSDVDKEESTNMLMVQANNNHKRFRDEYLQIPGCQSWLQKVEYDPKKFYCKHCQKEMLGGKWEVMKHLRSKKHQQMSEKAFQFELDEQCDLVDFEDEDNQEDAANFSVESEQIEYLKYEEIEDPNQNQPIDLYRQDELVPTILNEFSELSEASEVENSYSDITAILNQLYADSFTNFDVALHCSDGTIQAHRCILAAASVFFRELFKSSIHFEIEPIINIHLPDYSSTTITLLIKFLYSGQVFLPPESVNEFADICHELNINTINSNVDFSSHTRKTQECDQVVENLSNLLNCKILPQNEPPVLDDPNVTDSDAEEIDDDYLAFKLFCKKKLKKKKVKSLGNRMDSALIEVLAGGDPSATAKKYQINTNELVSHVNRYKNIQQMTSNISSIYSSQVISTIPTVYKIKRAEDNNFTPNQETFISNKPNSSCGLTPLVISNSSDTQMRLQKTFNIQVFNK